MHRDISVGNILITNHGRGLLIDWDLSKPVEDLVGPARQTDRTVSMCRSTFMYAEPFFCY
jgi:serine/threonine protein kinase